MIVNEAAAIKTAILQIDFLPDSSKPRLSDDFRRYLDARIAYFAAGEDNGRVETASNEAMLISGEIWKDAVAASCCNIENYFSFYAIVPALNTMRESLFKRNASRILVTPGIVVWVLTFMLLLSGFLAGYGARGRKWNIALILSFSLMTSMTFYLILELDRPRAGYINMLEAERQMEDLKTMFIDHR